MSLNAVNIFSQMQNELIENISYMLAMGNFSTAEYLQKKLAQLGTLKELNTKTVNFYSRLAAKEFKREIYEEGSTAFLDAGISDVAVMSDSVKNILSAWETQTYNKFRDLGMALIDKSQQIYIDIIYKSTAESLTGIKTLQESIRDTAQAWFRRGLPALKDIAGRTWSVEAYTSMVIRSNIRAAVTAIQDQVFEENDIDLVEVSSHLGARPLCSPYQGKVYSRSGTSKMFPALSSTSMGQVAGLFGINCGHRMYAYNHKAGKTYKPYPVKENERAYAQSQTQRSFERNVRAAKRSGRVESILKSQKSLREFIAQTGRTRKYYREKVFEK